ncbi:MULTISPECIES: helix-turn-helix domain-containing protein [Providencia]|uniref:Helix-turn-helix domain-containing protein n=1 Tax=Providencia rettgeri TaxID=587 RepID=A0A427HBS0_PRORE|nr:helix-turn-helix domain-containing protein [Providencia rettgeri]ELR5216568.1 helix-turn-helix domain-containing protein [Providencia rettgeri]MBV2190920.1 helix-turn-helix domain-containing protein [Providencia rettgeri]HEC8322754.1 helix-turn-helix domain-containing protein [Providencia rettgeri]
MHDELDVSQVSQLSGLAASTLRYYEEKGLIKPIGRKGLKRVYQGKDVITRLSLIALGQEAKFTLDEIAIMLNHKDGPNIERASLLEKAEEIEQTIQGLLALKKGILHIANCPEENHFLCPNFQKIMENSLKSKPLKKSQR